MHPSYKYPIERIADYKEKVRAKFSDELPPSIICSIEYLIEHLYKETLNIENLKDACTIRDKNFSSRFSLYTGTTPKRFILEHRTNAAKILLQETPLTVSQIGILVGFSSHSSFSKAFKKSTGGVNPSVWRGKIHIKNQGKVHGKIQA